MANKPHNRPKILQEAAGAYHIAAAAPIPPTQNELFGSSGKYISEDDYFAYYYGFGDINYEWNNGILEAKPMSDPTKARMYAWLFRLLMQYLEIHPIAKYIMLEIGFRIDIQARTLPDVGKRAIRKPDLGIILNDNPIPLGDHDRTYNGICDLCIESLSDSTKSEIERDVMEKKAEYSAAGVKEYYIIDESNRHMHFFRLNDLGKYIEILPDADDVIRSEVLKGFQFRVGDLHNQPRLIELAIDPVYQSFILPEYQAIQQASLDVSRENDRLAAELRKLGIDPETLND